jgi:hypothetical protein
MWALVSFFFSAPHPYSGGPGSINDRRLTFCFWVTVRLSSRAWVCCDVCTWVQRHTRGGKRGAGLRIPVMKSRILECGLCFCRGFWVASVLVASCLAALGEWMASGATPLVLSPPPLRKVSGSVSRSGIRIQLAHNIFARGDYNALSLQNRSVQQQALAECCSHLTSLSSARG